MVICVNQGIMRRWLLVALMAVLLSGCGLSGRQGSLATAAKYEAHGQYRAAYIESKKVLQHDSKNGMAWLLLGRASLMLGNPQDAINDLQNAKANGVSKVQWAIPLGRALLITQQFATLLKTLSPTDVTSAGDRAYMFVLQGDAYLGLKQPDKAKQSYQSAIAIKPGNPQALVGLAKVAGSENDLTSARKYVQQAIASRPDDANAWIFKGDLAFDTQDYSAAGMDYEKALGMKSHDLLPQEQFYATARLADSQIQQNKLENALGHIATLEKMAPGQPYPHYLHAVVYYKQGHFNDAVNQLQQVLKVIPNNEPAQLLLGAVNYGQGNFSQAEMYLSNVLGLQQNNVAARKLLALTLYREGQPQQALKVLRPAVPGNLSDAALLALIQKNAAEGVSAPGSVETRQGSAGSPLDTRLAGAQKAMATGHVDEAIRLLKELPAGNAPLEAQRYTMMVLAYLREKRAGEAVRTAAEYAHQNPKLSAAHVLYGTALVAAGKRAEAHAEYTQAYKLDPGNIAALMSLGSLDVLEGRRQDAVDRYQMVLKVDPENILAMTALGRVAAEMGDRAQAISWFKRVIHAAPKAVDSYLDLILLYSSGGQFADALSIAKDLMKVAPDDPRALNALGAVEMNAGKYKEALKPLEQAVKAAPQEPLYRTNLARAQILNREFQDAEANLTQVNKSAPDNVQAVILLAFLKLHNGDMAGALSLAHGLQTHRLSQVAGLVLEGDLYMTKKMYAKATQAYQRGLKLDYIKPLVIKTFLARNDSGTKDADRVLLTWLDRHPDDDATRMLLGQYYLDHAKYDLSAGQFQRVLKDYPSNIVALNNLAWIYTQQDNPKALSLAERAYTLAPASANIKDTYGWALIMRGQAEKALPILLQAVKQAPAVPAIQYHLAVAQARTGDKAGAMVNLQTLLKPGESFPERAAAEKLYRNLGGKTAYSPVRK
ncbi:MAG: XrtA/PEP-CTERM system TPR-repeat protein PrsT [Gammaproteobacteria bacterium]